MSRTVCHEVYKFDELDDITKEKAHTWYREGALNYNWWDGVYSDAKDAAQYLGIAIDSCLRREMGGYTPEGKWDGSKERTVEETCIYFSGFSSQGDGAYFEGTWQAHGMKTLIDESIRANEYEFTEDGHIS